MKIKSTVFARTLALVLAVASLLSLAVFPLALEPKESFLLLAAGIGEGNFAERTATLDDCEKAYLALSGSDLTDTEVVSAYENVTREKQALEKIAETADAFLLAVGAIKDAANINTRITAVQNAKDLLFEDESYPGITEALASLSEVESAVSATAEICDEFVLLIDDAQNANNEESYRDTKKALDDAEALMDRIDDDYPGVFGAKSAYHSLRAALKEVEDINDGFLLAIEALRTSTTYADIRRNYDNCVDLYERIEVLDYDGIEEGVELMEEKKEELREASAKATAFILAVDAIGKSDNFMTAFAAANGALEGVDQTVDGVSEAKKKLERTTEEYNETIRTANEEAKAIFRLAVGLAG